MCAIEGFDSFFNNACIALLKQGVHSKNINACRYREAGSENKCAIGHMIPDDLYSPDMERRRICTLIGDEIFRPVIDRWVSDFNLQDKYQPEKELQESGEFIFLLTALQDLHDDNNPNMWPQLILNLAQKYVISINSDLEKILDEWNGVKA